jgi:type IV pilus assembly protein PilC
MPIFHYEALDAQGREVKDEIEALTSKEAISKIRNRGYFPTKVRAKTALKKVVKEAAARPKARRGAGRRVKIKLLTQFARQLATLQDAGLPILRSLRVLQQQQKPGAFKRILGYTADDIEGGASLSEAMARYQKCFNRLFVNMVAAGEAGGVLDIILVRLADFMEKTQRLRGRIKSALTYPVVVMTAAFLIVLGLMWKVIPQFTSVLSEMTDQDLPKLTQYLITISNWIAYSYGWAWLIGVPIAVIFILRSLRRFRVFRLIFDTVKLYTPIIKKITGKTSIARWTRTLGTLISAGVPILEAINITAETAGNEVYARMLNNVNHSIRQGDTFANPLRRSKTVDAMVYNMVDVGEETGDLDKMLLKVADTYEEEVDVLVASLMSLLEPVIIIILGLTVGTIVLSIFLPMVSLITGLSQQTTGS